MEMCYNLHVRDMHYEVENGSLCKIYFLKHYMYILKLQNIVLIFHGSFHKTHFCNTINRFKVEKEAVWKWIIFENLFQIRPHFVLESVTLNCTC